MAYRFGSFLSWSWLALLALSCGDSTPAEPDAAADPTLEAIEGLALFSNTGCGNCHCNDGSGGCNLDAPNIQGAEVDELREQLLNDSSHPTQLEEVTDTDLEALALFLQRLDGSEVELEQSSLISDGFALYLAGGCVECHLNSGEGSSQGGFGVPISGTNPDKIYNALVADERACHPLRRDPEASPAQCRDLVETNEIVDILSDMRPQNGDAERTALAFFLNFIAPQPVQDVVPCENRAGEICTVAGNGTGAFVQDNIPANQAQLYFPLELNGTDWNDDGVLDLVVVDWNNHRVRVINLDVVTYTNPDDESTGVLNRITTIAGSGQVSGDGALYHPTDAAFDAEGALVTASWHSQNIYRYPRDLVDDGDRGQLAGACDLGCADDQGGTVSVGDTILGLPASSAIHPDGRIFFSESGCSRLRILDVRDVTPSQQLVGQCSTEANFYDAGTLMTLAGKVSCDEASGECGPENGYGGDGEAATEAVFNVDNTPAVANFGIHLSREDEPEFLYVADSKNNVIRRVRLLEDPPTIELFAGQPGVVGFADGDALDAALFNFPANVFVAESGLIYVADARNHAIRTIDPDTGEVVTVAGTGRAGFNGDNRSATDATLNLPSGVWVHPEDGRLFIADALNHRVRVVCPEDGCPEAP